MNKWQIICPLVAMLAVLVVFGAIGVRNRSRDYQSYAVGMAGSIGDELIRSTNSEHLSKIGAPLQQRLSLLLTSKTHVANALYKDAPPPVGDGSACSRVILINEHGDGLGIRFRYSTNVDCFEIAGYWDIPKFRGSSSP
jgi:hypothetical protein